MKPRLPLALALAALASSAVAGTPTTNYAWSKPTVSADADTWGTQLNTDLDGIDAVVFGKLDKSGGTMTGTATLSIGSTTVAPLKFQNGVVLTTPAADAVEWDGVHAFVTQHSPATRKQLAYIDDALTGSAAKWTTGRTISLTGAVTGASGSFDGSGNLSFATTLAAGQAVSNIGYTPANIASPTFTGKVTTAAAANPGTAGFNMAPGVVPGTLANGDCWITSTAVQCRVGGVTTTLGSSGGSGLLSTNNLSDVADAPTSRTNLGLGTASTVNTGTSGATIPMLNGANTWSGAQTLSGAGIVLAAGTTGLAPLKLTSGINLTSAAAGAVEWNGTNLFVTQTSGPTRKTVAFTDSNMTGPTSGNAATATVLATGRTIAMTGDVAWTSPSFDGSGNVTAAGAIQAGAVSNADLANVATQTIKGRTTAGTGAPTDLTATQARAVVLPAFSSHAGQVLTVNSGASDAAWSGYPIFASLYATVSSGVVGTSAGNNASIAHNGALNSGKFTVTLTSAAPNANYSVTVSGGKSGGVMTCQEDGNFGGRTTTQFGLFCFNGSGAQDPDFLSALVVAN